jgi:uncharacterized phiE125 gp8 family phage protein
MIKELRPIYKIATAPAAEPVTAADIKLQLRLAVDAAGAAAYAYENDLIDSYIKVARKWVENISGRSMITQTWDMYLDSWPSGNFIEIGKPPLQSVTYVKYTDSDEAVTTWSTDEYSVDTDSEPGRIVLGYDYSWPDFTPHPQNPINIRFVAGYGDDGEDVEAELILAVKLLVGHFYFNRENSYASGTNMEIKEIPMGVVSLIQNHRIIGF